MWHLLLITAFVIGQTLGCIECDHRGKEARNKFNTLIQSQIDDNVDAYITIKRFAKATEKQVLDYLEDEVGILDDYALSDIVSEYKKSVDVIEGTDFKEVQLLHIIGLHFQRLKEKVKGIVQDSYKRRCPNKQDADSCGLMVQKYTNCKTCVKENVVCAGGPPKNQEYFDRCSCLCTSNRCFDLRTGLHCSPCKDHKSYLADTIDCGVRNIKVTEDEDLILDCSFQWYAMLEDSYKNIFITYPDIKPKVTEEPYLVIKGIQMEESGQYMCTTLLKSDVPVSNIIYHVTVLRGSEWAAEEYKPRPTLPPVLETATPEPPFPEGLQINKNNTVLVISVAGSITIVLIVGICICIMWRRKMKSEDPLQMEPI